MINYSKIRDLLRELSVDNDRYKIDYSMVPITSNSIYEEDGTKLVDLKASVEVNVKQTGEKAEFLVDLLKIPHYGESGFTIRGTNKQVISSYTIAYGWYVMPEDKSFRSDYLKLTTEKGYNLVIYAEDYKLYVTNGKKRKDPSVPLAIFLKALSGKSFGELRSLIGMDSIYVAKTFSEEEPVRSDCIDIVVRTLIAKYRNDEQKFLEYSNLSIDDRYKVLTASFTSGYYMNLGNTTGVRMKRSTSFKERCKNLYLAKKLEVNGRVFDEKINLDSKTLEIIDYLPVDSLDVMTLERKYYNVRKASIFNFRALDMTLEEDIETNGRVFKKGTVLDLEDLKELDKTNLDKILVSLDGKVQECTRDIFDGRLKVLDIISMVQVYLDTLGGIPLYDNIYDLTNQNLDTLDIKVASFVSNNCRYINDSILDHLESGTGELDLLEKVLNIKRPPLDELLKYVMDPKTRESQQAEINNTIQKVSKEHRVSKNVKRTTAGMVGVQESQFGRLDPIESPESSKIGIVHSLTYFAKTNEFGFIASPFIRVNNGEIIDTTPVYLTADEQKGQFVASWDETFYEELPDGTKKKKDYILALTDETIMEVPIEDVKYMQVGPYDTMSPARMQVPFPEHSAQKRILMSSNHHKQAVAPINNERPIVSSGGDSIIDDGIITAHKLLSEYYDSQEGTLEVTREEFLKSRIKLVNVDTVRNYKILGLEVLDHPGHFIKTEIPFMQKASSGVMFSYVVNNESLVYSGDDVVAYSSDYDIRKYDLHKHVDFGNMEVDESKFKRALGLAKNLVVGWKTHESSTIDDAVVIRQGLTDLNGYTTIDFHSVTYELKQETINRVTGVSEVETFGFKGSPLSHMTSEGIPRVGAVLEPGDVVVATKIERRLSTRSSGTKLMEERPNYVTLESKQEGQVVFSSIEGREARILLANVKSIEKGDKIAGRHGNKGVIAKVLPDHLMPYDPETGLVLDIILNPLGIPSRSNISQLLEAALGFAMKKEGKVCVVSPFKGDTLDFVKNMANKANVHPMVLRDGRTGQDFKRPINVGVMYVLQLEHRVSSKIKGIGIAGRLDPVFNQPSKGGGGQALGEYETWVLMAVGARKVLQDLFSVQSDDLRAINVLRNSISEGAENFEIEGNNNNDHLFQVLMRGLCVEPKVSPDGDVSFKPLTDREIRALSTTPVDVFDKSSLGSQEIFGATTNSMSKFENRTTWSWMPLHCEMVHPFHLIKTKIYRYMLVVKREGKDFTKMRELVMTDTILRDIISCRAYVEQGVYQGKKRYIVTNGPTTDKLTGMKAIVEMLRNTDLEDIKAHHRRIIEKSSSESSVLASKRALRFAEDFEESGMKLEDFIITSIPVIPLAFRPKSKFDHIQQDFDFYYGRIMDEVAKYKSSSVKTEEDVFKIFLRIVEFSGLPFTGFVKEQNQYKPLLKYFTGRESSDKKHGRLRESVLKKRILFSGRTVIVPSGDITRPPTKIGIPYMLCIRVWSPYIIQLLHKMFDNIDLPEQAWKEILEATTNKLRFARMVSKHKIGEYTVDELYDKIYSIVAAYVEGYTDPTTGEQVVKPRVVIAGRQPSLHKFSIRAYHPVIVQGKAIEIHPIVCGGYNADFDGDQMWFAALVNESACEEALELLSPREGIINPKDGSLALEHSQDIRLGVYYATMLKDNVDDIKKSPVYDLTNIHYYSNIGTLEADIDLGLIELHSLVCFNKDGRSYISTAGRILFNALIPNDEGFTDKSFTNVLGIEGIKEECYNDLRFDGLISGNGGTRKTPKYLSLGKITRWSFNTFNRDDNINFFQKVSEFGFKYSDMSGITLSLEDLKENPDTQKFIDRANQHAEIINRRYYKGSLSDEERKEELIYLYTKLREKISERFMDTFDRNNNMFIIFDSGSRGNKDQIMQACGIIGVLQKSKEEVLETPVLSNYTKGTSCFETLQLSFSTRTGVASTQNETSVSGELTRLAVYMAGGFEIVEEDCGAPIEEVTVKYGDPLGTVIGPGGSKLTVDDLLDKKVVGDESVLKKLKAFLGKGNKITSKSLEILLKKKITTIVCEDGEYKIFYKLDSMMNSFFFLRYAEGLDHLIDGKYISEETIASIESQGLSHIKMRTILACRSVGGCCAKCYGLKYDTYKLPRVGEFVGIESSQSIGEPASQLTLSLFHKGGAAGESVDKGVELYSSTLRGGFPKNLKPAAITNEEGYVEIDYARNLVYVNGKVVASVSEGLTVDHGEYVDRWEPLTSGFVMPSANVINPTLEYIRFVQMSLLEVHYRIFEVNNISVNVRHFEIFARAQTSIVTIYESEDERFKEGEQYELNDIESKGALDKVKYIFGASKDSEVIRTFGGIMTQMAHGHLSDTLGRTVLGAKVSKATSLISMLMQGRNVHTEEVKLFEPPRYLGVVSDTMITPEDNDRISDILLTENIVEELDTSPVNVLSDVDWGDLLSDQDSLEPQETSEDSYIKLDEEEAGNEKDNKEVKKMDLFN